MYFTVHARREYITFLVLHMMCPTSEIKFPKVRVMNSHISLYSFRSENRREKVVLFGLPLTSQGQRNFSKLCIYEVDKLFELLNFSNPIFELQNDSCELFAGTISKSKSRCKSV